MLSHRSHVIADHPQIATVSDANDSDVRCQLFVDLTVLVRQDSKSGIQRVVRSILTQLLTHPPEHYRVEPVYRDGSLYRYARTFMARCLDASSSEQTDAPARVRAGDCFVGLDFDPRLDDRAQSWLSHHSRRGMKIVFVVYDMLPLLMPDSFPGFMGLHVRDWLQRVTSVADGLVAISRSVADELADWMNTHPQFCQRPLDIGYFHLCAGIDSTAGVSAAASKEKTILETLKGHKTVLMVGTLEPRKGHALALEAFEQLWAEGDKTWLVIVGRGGWMVKSLEKRLRRHPERHRRLFWLEDADDTLLAACYEKATVLLAASYGEGFGLPLIEAARHDLPIIARDLAVFREVAGAHACYFSGTTPAEVAATLRHWFDLHRTNRHPSSHGLRWQTWPESAEQLKGVVLDNQWYRHWQPGSDNKKSERK